MNLVVCLKQILDPELPARDFRVDPARRVAERGAVNLVLNIFCANALETALQFRERHGGKIAALSFGASTTEDVLRKALALNVDEAVLIEHDDATRPDPLMVAQVLAAAIKKRSDVDLLLVGRESGDWGEGQTGGLLAEELGWPCVSFVDHLEAIASEDGVIRVRRQTETGTETIEVRLPLVVTVTNNDRNVPRIPKTRDVMQSSRRPLAKLPLAELDLASSQGVTSAYSEVIDLQVPRHETRCEFITADTLDQRIESLAQRIVAVVQSA